MNGRYEIKSIMGFLLIVALICGCFVFYVNQNSSSESTVYAAEEDLTIVLTVDSPVMIVNGEEIEIDSSGSVPVIKEGRTLVPIRAIVEAAGGEISWDGENQQTDIICGGNTVRLVTGSNIAIVNGEEASLDVAPEIINSRTMLPLRFVSESLGFNIDWNSETKEITIITAEIEDAEVAEQEETPVDEEANTDAPIVYFTSDISAEGLVDIYNMLDFTPEGKVAVKMSTGEPPASNYLRPELIKDLVQSVNGTIVESNTAYGGQRAESAKHWQVIEDHGFLDIANADILDEDGSLEIPVKAEGSQIQSDFVGAHLENYDTLICLSHFKGHAMAGYGGAIKNMSIGIASSEGKNWIHTGGNSMTSWMGGDQDEFLEAMGDATSAVVDFFDGKVVYINVMNRLSVDCDCSGNPSEPDMHDIGILASYDPVALDQACIDLIYEQKDGDGASLVQRIESRNGLHTLEHAEKIGLGMRVYNLVYINEN